MEPIEKKAFEPSGLVPRSIVRTFERFRQQLLPGSETAAIREYRISRYQVLVSARCLFILLTIPIATNWFVSSWLLSPLIEHFWNTQQNEIFLNSYQEERAFAELEFFSEKLFFESLLNKVDSTELLSDNSNNLKTDRSKNWITNTNNENFIKNGIDPLELVNIDIKNKRNFQLPRFGNSPYHHHVFDNAAYFHPGASSCVPLKGLPCLTTHKGLTFSQLLTSKMSKPLLASGAKQIEDNPPSEESPKKGTCSAYPVGPEGSAKEKGLLCIKKNCCFSSLYPYTRQGTCEAEGERPAFYIEDVNALVQSTGYSYNETFLFPPYTSTGTWVVEEDDIEVPFLRTDIFDVRSKKGDLLLTSSMSSSEGGKRSNPFLLRRFTTALTSSQLLTSKMSKPLLALRPKEGTCFAPEAAPLGVNQSKFNKAFLPTFIPLGSAASSIGNLPSFFPLLEQRHIYTPKGGSSGSTFTQGGRHIFCVGKKELAKLNIKPEDISNANALQVSTNKEELFVVPHLLYGKITDKQEEISFTEDNNKFCHFSFIDLVDKEDTSFFENSSFKIKEKIQDKILNLAIYYNQQTILSITNIVGDFVSLFTLGCLFIWMKPEISILKSFLIEAIYSLSDTTKSFLLILLTDLLVGFHSPRGWETALELLLKHFGLPENQDFVFLFVATFPVLLDTVFKYWIFRHLNKISPSTVATYHSMIE